MPVDDNTPPRGIPTIEKVYNLLDRIRSELLGELAKLEGKLDSELTSAEAAMQKWQADHQTRHEREGRQRWQVTAWATTTLITAGGTLFGIIWALTH